jgi:hypothetical protein
MDRIYTSNYVTGGASNRQMAQVSTYGLVGPRNLNLLVWVSQIRVHVLRAKSELGCINVTADTES